MRSITEIQAIADQYGLVIRGGFRVNEKDQVPHCRENQPAQVLLLFGNAGSSIWAQFSDSPEKNDNQPDPMNRWSQRIGELIAAQLDGLALFPFSGPPYQPFIPWAKKAESLVNSKLGMLIHPQYGLWHAYRFAIALHYDVEGLTAPNIAMDVCADCAEQPCLSSCPVDAFSDQGYDVESCYRYLNNNQDSSCRSTTCAARLACPEGRNFRYITNHARFHMDAFYSSIARRFDAGDSSKNEG